MIRCGSGSSWSLEGHPPSPPLQLEDPSLKPQPVHSHLLPPFSPHPPSSFAMAGQAAVGEGSPRGPSKLHLGPDPHLKVLDIFRPTQRPISLAHQNRTIAIASVFRPDGAKSPEIPQQEGVLGSEIAARNRRSLATSIAPLNRNASLLSLVSEIARFLVSAMGIAIANRKNRCDFGAQRPISYHPWSVAKGWALADVPLPLKQGQTVNVYLPHVAVEKGKSM